MHNRGYEQRHGTPPTYPFPASEDEDRGTCTAVLGTTTNALQAQRVLANAAIHSSVTKISSMSAKGCAYGITYPCAQERHVRTILSQANITVKKYMGG